MELGRYFAEVGITNPKLRLAHCLGFTGDIKALALSTLEASADAIVSAGLAAFTSDDGTSTTAASTMATAMPACRPLPLAEYGSTMTSTMMDVNLDRSGPVPLHDQVAAQIRRAIADGEAGPGERLPLAKDIAAVLGVNKNTVLRALHLLRDEGLLEFRRGRGITVVGTPQRGAVLARAQDLLEYARHHGFARDEVIAMIESLP